MPKPGIQASRKGCFTSVAIIDVTLLLQERALYYNTVKRSGYVTELLKKLCTFYANPRVMTVYRKQP
jgi:hypothetical protein